MENKNRELKLYTTHCHPSKRPKLIGQPAIINGKRAIAYMKDDKVESYIPWDEATEKVFNGDLPEMKVGF